MSTVDKNTAIAITANYGKYPGNTANVAVKIVKYNNMFNGGIAYGVVWKGQDLDIYEKSPACRNVRTVWTYEDDLVGEW